MADPVNHPSHYTQGDVECIDCIRAALGPRGFRDYCVGNCIKYLFRYQHKAGQQDLEKAGVYLAWATETEVESSDTETPAIVSAWVRPEDRATPQAQE